MAKQVTAKERAARIQAAKEREERARAAQERSEKMKKAFTVVVCVILVLALSIPTMALTVFSS